MGYVGGLTDRVNRFGDGDEILSNGAGVVGSEVDVCAVTV